METLAGKIDMSDVIEGSIWLPPVIAVTLTRWRAPVQIGGGWQMPLELAAYVVTEEMAIGATAVRRRRQPMPSPWGSWRSWPISTCRAGVSTASPTRKRPRPDRSSPPRSTPRGCAYYAVTWRQSLIGLGTDPNPPEVYTGVESVEDGL